MGVKCSKPNPVKLPSEIVVLGFYEDPSNSRLDISHQLQGVSDEKQLPIEGFLTKVTKNDMQFGFIWGYGLGRCTLRLQVHRYLPNVCMFVLIIDHMLTAKTSAAYVADRIQTQLREPAREDAQVLVVVKTSRDKESRPSDEDMFKDVSALLDGCRQNVEFMSHLDTYEATMEKVMEVVAGWVRRCQDQRAKTQEETQPHHDPAKKSYLVTTVKQLVKTLPKKISMALN